MPSESKGLNGKIDFNYNWNESASGHDETTSHTYLECVDGKIHFVDFHERHNVFKGRKVNKKVIGIETSVLIELIKKHGKEIQAG